MARPSPGALCSQLVVHSKRLVLGMGVRHEGPPVCTHSTGRRLVSSSSSSSCCCHQASPSGLPRVRCGRVRCGHVRCGRVGGGPVMAGRQAGRQAGKPPAPCPLPPRAPPQACPPPPPAPRRPVLCPLRPPTGLPPRRSAPSACTCLMAASQCFSPWPEAMSLSMADSRCCWASARRCGKSRAGHGV